MQPTFSSFFCGKLILLKLDIDKFKSHLKEDLRLWRIDSDSIEYDPIEIIDKDHEYLKTIISQQPHLNLLNIV